MEKLTALFKEFIESKEDRSDIIYSMTQSTVEPIICFKFGSWLTRQGKSNINILEINNIDLIVGIDNKIYFIEFGHLLNLLKHRTNNSVAKIESDCNKLPGKIHTFCNNHMNLVEGKGLYKVTIGLFSDFKGIIRNGRFAINYTGNRETGTFLKYGTSKNDDGYFGTYVEEFKEFGCVETPIIQNEISLWWDIKLCED